jgi:hypothetical protein
LRVAGYGLRIAAEGFRVALVTGYLLLIALSTIRIGFFDSLTLSQQGIHGKKTPWFNLD